MSDERSHGHALADAGCHYKKHTLMIIFRYVIHELRHLSVVNFSFAFQVERDREGPLMLWKIDSLLSSTLHDV